jgi:MFS family permease
MAAGSGKLTDRLLVQLIRLGAVIGVSAAAASTVMTIPLIGPAAWLSGFDWFVASFAIFFGVLAWVVAPKEPKNALVWIMATAAFFGGLTVLGWPVAGLLGGDTAGLVGETIPAELPRSSAWVIFFTGWLWNLALLPPLTFGLLLFPNGTLPSPRWRWVGVLAGVGVVASAVASAWSYRPSNDGVADESTLIDASAGLVLLAAILSLAALIQGFRRSRGAERQQYKWIAWGTSIFVPTFLGLGFVLGGSEYQNLLIVPIMMAELVFLGSYAMAIGKYRLFEIDRIISRTISYGLVVGLLAVTYLTLVAALTSILPAQSSLAVAAGTLAIAALFNPLRKRIQRAVDRNFNRTHYNSQRVVDEFARSMRDLVEVEAVATRWERVVRKTMQPRGIGVWIRGDLRGDVE